MTKLIVGMTVAIGCLGILVFVWSLINTRNRYFKEYINRKKND